MPAMRPLMSHRAWSTPLMALFSTGPLPIGGIVGHLPDVLYAVHGAAQQQRLEIELHGRLHQIGALGESGAAIAVKAGLVGGDLDHGQARTLGGAFDYADVLDFGHRHAARGAGYLILRLGIAAGQKSGRRSSSAARCTQHVTSTHGISPSLRFLAVTVFWLARTVGWPRTNGKFCVL